MNNGKKILQLQNEDTKIDMLLAQRKLYSDAKKLQSILLIFVILVPIIITILEKFNYIKTDDNFTLILYSISALILEYILQKKIDSMKNKAASIQEKFDTDVFGISKNDLLGSAIGYDEIRKYSKKYKGKPDKVKNWYSKKIEALNTNIAIIFCQRMNITYDQNIKKKYRNLLCGLLFIVALIIILLTENYSVKHLVAKIILPLSPMIKFIYDEIKQIKTSVNNLNRLRENIENTLKSLSINATIKDDKLRSIQDMIFTNRVSSPLIPDYIYRYYRAHLEDQMNYNVEKKIEELI